MGLQETAHLVGRGQFREIPKRWQCYEKRISWPSLLLTFPLMETAHSYLLWDLKCFLFYFCFCLLVCFCCWISNSLKLAIVIPIKNLCSSHFHFKIALFQGTRESGRGREGEREGGKIPPSHKWRYWGTTELLNIIHCAVAELEFEPWSSDSVYCVYNDYTGWVLPWGIDLFSNYVLMVVGLLYTHIHNSLTCLWWKHFLLFWEWEGNSCATDTFEVAGAVSGCFSFTHDHR